MKTNLSQMIGFLLLGLGAIAVNAAPATTTAKPAPRMLMLSTPLIHGGAMQKSGRCSVFNAGTASMTLVDVHAEDGQGKTLASTDASNCANKELAGLRACTITFDMNTTDDSAVCLSKVAAPKNGPKAKATPTPPPPPPAPMLSMELLDNAGAVLVYANGVTVTPPPPQGGTGTPPPPPQDGNGTPPPPQGGTGTTPPPPPQGGTGTPPPQGGTQP